MLIYTCPECGGDLTEEMIGTLPPVRSLRCNQCGWNYEEREEILRLPYSPPRSSHDGSMMAFPDPCRNCLNNPANGGSGICNCILGQPKIT